MRLVRLGDTNLNSTADDKGVQEFSVVARIRHPQYRPPSQYNDIGLLKLDRKVVLTDYVRPACLPFHGDLNAGYLVATGWGKTEFSGEDSAVLQKVYLDLFDYPTCQQAYASTPASMLANGINQDLQICAGSYTDRKDTCQVRNWHFIYIYL